MSSPQPQKTFHDLGISVNPNGPTEQDSLCPKCSHTRKKKNHRCLSVNVQDGTFYCHHCYARGSLNSGWDGDQPGMEYGAPLGPIKPKDYKPAKALPPTPESATEDNPPATHEEFAWNEFVKWFAGRGISELTMRRNRLTVSRQYFGEAKDGEGEELWCIAYPYFRDNIHVNTKYRTGPETLCDHDDRKLFKMDPGAERVFWGLDDITPSTDTIIFVEGENDKLALEEGGVNAGLTQSVAILSVPNGAPSIKAQNYDSQFSFMDGTEDLFQNIKRFVMACDSDAPGRKLSAELARRLSPEKCQRVDWNKFADNGEPIKDANDALMLVGRKDFKRCFARAIESWPIDGLFSITDFRAKLIDRWQYGPKEALSTGWKLMDPSYRILDSSTTLVTGVPNVGKSTFLNALAINMMMRHDFRIAICSPEWMPIDDQIQAMLKVIVGATFDPGSKFQMTPQQRDWAIDWLHERCMFIYPEVPTIPSILEVADIAKRKIGIRGLIIDPWSEIETSHMKPNGISQTDWIGQCLKMIKRWSVTNLMHTWLSVHPTKLDKLETGEWPVPDIYDMSGSAKFADMADFILSLWRSNFDQEGRVEVHVKKARFRNAGRRGDIVNLYFDEATGRFSYRIDGIGTTGTTDPWNAGNIAITGD